MNETPASRPLLSGLGLRKSYQGSTALCDVSVDLRAGEIVALLGVNGAGKSSLLGCLIGLLLVDAGTITIFSEDLRTLSQQARQNTGFVPQEFSGFSWMRVTELLNFLGAFYPATRRSWPALSDWASLDPRKRVRELSGGQRQRLAILLAMRHQPRLLLLDEPVSQLDPQARRDFLTLLREYVRAQDAAVLLSSHIVSDLEHCANRFLVLQNGQMVADWPASTLAPGEAEQRFLTLTGARQ